jgi:hypothetical protein
MRTDGSLVGLALISLAGSLQADCGIQFETNSSLAQDSEFSIATVRDFQIPIPKSLDKIRLGTAEGRENVTFGRQFVFEDAPSGPDSVVAQAVYALSVFYDFSLEEDAEVYEVLCTQKTELGELSFVRMDYETADPQISSRIILSFPSGEALTVLGSRESLLAYLAILYSHNRSS